MPEFSKSERSIKRPPRINSCGDKLRVVPRNHNPCKLRLLVFYSATATMVAQPNMHLLDVEADFLGSDFWVRKVSHEARML